MNTNSQFQQPRNPMPDIKTFFKSGSILSRLILINVGIWVLVSAMRVIAFLFNVEGAVFEGYILEYLALPASFDVLITKPWTLITYMFLHIDFFHILFNMLWLYWFGKIFLQYLSAKQLLKMYFWGGISGGLLYILAYNIFPAFSSALPIAKAMGASASVMAIVTSISFFVPNYFIHLLFFGRIRILYLAIALFVIDFFMIRSSNAGGHLAHIGGFIYGFLYIYLMRKGKMPRTGLGSFSSYFVRKKKKADFDATFYNQKPVTDDEYNKNRAKDQNKIDEILDKISKDGYDKLTKEEKDFLFRNSKNN